MIPNFYRHHLHRYSISGYEGGLNLLTWITNSILDQLDEELKISQKQIISSIQLDNSKTRRFSSSFLNYRYVLSYIMVIFFFNNRYIQKI